MAAGRRDRLGHRVRETRLRLHARASVVVPRLQTPALSNRKAPPYRAHYGWLDRHPRFLQPW